MSYDQLRSWANMNRRALLLGGGGLGLAAAFRNAPLIGSALAAEPKRGGVMTLQISSDPSNFDMFSNTSSFTLNVVGACYNSLIMYDPANPEKIVGDLAQSWTQSADGKQVTFALRRGVKFHDGAPFTAADVKATFDFLRNPPAGRVSTRKALFTAVQNIVVVDDFTVRFDLSRPSPSLLANLAIGWMVVAPKHVLEAKGDMKKDVVGTGPFKLKTYLAGNYIDLERNPAYHIPDRPYMDGMRIYIIPEPATIMAFMRTEKLDYWDGIGARDAKTIESQFPNVVQVMVSPAPTACNTLEINTRRKPFDDIRVRRAIALSIDHADAVRIGADVGATDMGGFMAPGSEWALPADQLRQIAGFGGTVEANRQEARKLLADAGFPNGFNTTMNFRLGPEVSQVTAVFAADQISKIGIKANIVAQESGIYFDSQLKGNFDMASGSISSLTIDPDFVFGGTFNCNGASNSTGTCVAAIDTLLAQQSAEADKARRVQLVNQLDRAVLENYATIPMYHRRKRIALGRRIQNLVAHPEPDNNRRMQDVWIA